MALRCWCNVCGRGEDGWCNGAYRCYIGLERDNTVTRCIPNMTHGVRLCNSFPTSRCCDTNGCNSFNDTLDGGWTSTHSPTVTVSRDSKMVGAGVIAPAFVIAAVVALLGITRYAVYKKSKARMRGNLLANMESQDTSGLESSGFGPLLLFRRTIAKDLIRTSVIGEGRYGKVYKCTLKGVDLAVKVFTSRDGLESWTQEKKIYASIPLQHENVLSFFATDLECRTSVTQYLLVTHYHSNGSLYDYLKSRKSLDTHSLLRLLITTIAGLDYLHSEIHGEPYKAPIAHRDVKTKNILVKVDGSCCLADFGLAILEADIEEWQGLIDVNRGSRNQQLTKLIQVGTKRYLAPEVLDLSIVSQSLCAFQGADVYSYGLVMWEVLMNSGILAGSNSVQPCTKETAYRVAYDEIAANNPSFNDMMEIVCKQKHRPTIPVLRDGSCLPAIIQDKLQHLMRGCWCASSIRLTPRRIHSSLTSIISHLKPSAETNNA